VSNGSNELDYSALLLSHGLPLKMWRVSGSRVNVLTPFPLRLINNSSFFFHTQ
jgi:hypothetical protein